MSILIAREILCDTCTESVRLDSSMTEEWPSLRKAGWTRKRGQHFCPECSAIEAAQNATYVKRPRPPVEFANAELGDEG